MATVQTYPDYAIFFGSLGVALAVSLCAIGSAYATARGGVAISAISIMRPELLMRSLLPIVMGGIVAIYGLIISILILNKLIATDYNSFRGFSHFASGLTVGICGIASGMAIGVITDAGLRAYAQQTKIYVTLVIVLVFGEVLGLYGLIVAVFLAVK